MNAKETVMDAARMGFVQIRRDHTTATVTVGTAVMVGIVQVLTTKLTSMSLHSETRLSSVHAGSVVFGLHSYLINVIISNLSIEIERTKWQSMIINSLNNLYCDWLNDTR